MSALTEGEFIAAARWRLANAQQLLEDGQTSLAVVEYERVIRLLKASLIPPSPDFDHEVPD
jgi:hypothetical protein